MLAVVRQRVKSILAAAGIDVRQPWQTLLMSLLFQPKLLEQGKVWRARLAGLFPQIDFRRFRAGDLIRLPVQLLWICVVRSMPLRPATARSERAGIVRRALDRCVAALTPLLTSRPAKKLERRARSLFFIDAKRLQPKIERYAQHRIWRNPVIRYGAYVIAGLLGAMCITTPFSTLAQIVFVTLLLATAMLIRRIPGQVPTLFLVVLSLTASTRYLWWRVAYTLNWDVTFDLVWGVVLLCAEVYTWTVLVLGYVQTAWPLKRAPIPLPSDDRAWPSVDVFIPTYNEPLKVVIPTVYAALSLDWPLAKLNIYLLDDGRRDEFRIFAEEAGIGYLIRPDNLHAKAGNLNHALGKTHGEYIAVFDCDHIPTRSFLQTTMGWFLRDPKLALLQTPHHFFSPDPFERNLGLFRQVPNEGELFYGVIQDCNDLWNATYFCGSCAIIKRSPLEQIGGVAVETVTEDAHTALKLQRLGYNS
ncbi:MAG: glycosyltransferase, partial [Burkholderiales bacterium]